ncbi:hypothetical protein [Hydrocarboniphaga sp.]
MIDLSDMLFSLLEMVFAATIGRGLGAIRCATNYARALTAAD